jgi:hypothetical protein
MHTVFRYENLKRRKHSGDLSIDGRIVLKHILMKHEDVDWILLSQDIMQWWDFMNIVMNLRIP